MPRLYVALLALTIVLAALAGELMWGDQIMWGTLDDSIIWGN